MELARLKQVVRKEAGLRSFAIVAIVGCFAGSIFGFFANYPWYWGSVFGLVAGITIKLFAAYNHMKTLRDFSKKAETARSANLARITEVKAKAFSHFMEYEDLGELYVFDIEENQLLALQGQEYYETVRFPCLHFEIVEIPDILYTVRPKSNKIEPVETFSSDVTIDVCAIPDRSVLKGELKNVREILSKALS